MAGSQSLIVRFATDLEPAKRGLAYVDGLVASAFFRHERLAGSVICPAYRRGTRARWPR
jgi:hypothetical protein